MSFILGVNDDNTQIVNAINYLITNLGQQNTLVVDAVTGQIISPFTGQVVSYLYQYINIRYATSDDGVQNFSQSPTNATYYGIQNSNSSVGTEVPSQYVWTLASPPFGTTNFLWYSTIGGRQILFVIAATAPSSLFQQVENNIPINLDVTTNSSNTSQINAYARVPGSPTVTPGTIVTTGQTLPSQAESLSTWNLNSTWALTDPNPTSTNSLYISNGQFNLVTNETTWNTPYVGQYNVTQLSQITSNAGTLTSGTIGGNIIVNTTGNVTGNVFTANTYNSANWAISVTPGANLLFQYLGANVMSVDSGGNVVLSGTLTQSGTPT